MTALHQVALFRSLGRRQDEIELYQNDHNKNQPYSLNCHQVLSGLCSCEKLYTSISSAIFLDFGAATVWTCGLQSDGSSVFLPLLWDFAFFAERFLFPYPLLVFFLFFTCFALWQGSADLDGCCWKVTSVSESDGVPFKFAGWEFLLWCFGGITARRDGLALEKRLDLSSGDIGEILAFSFLRCSWYPFVLGRFPLLNAQFCEEVSCGITEVVNGLLASPGAGAGADSWSLISFWILMTSWTCFLCISSSWCFRSLWYSSNFSSNTGMVRGLATSEFSLSWYRSAADSIPVLTSTRSVSWRFCSCCCCFCSWCLNMSWMLFSMVLVCLCNTFFTSSFTLATMEVTAVLSIPCLLLSVVDSNNTLSISFSSSWV